MHSKINDAPGLTNRDLDLLHNIEQGLPITADVSRADLLLYARKQADQLRVVRHVQPRSISSLYRESVEGQVLPGLERPMVLRALQQGAHSRQQRDLLVSGAPTHQEVFPVRNAAGHVIAAISIETNMIERERHRRRYRVFQQAVRWLQIMAVKGQLEGADALSPFGMLDGILYVDRQGRIAYLSGIATNLYRRLGYLEDIRGKRLSDLSTRDAELVEEALRAQYCLEAETKEGSRIWIRKVVPLRAPAGVRHQIRRRLPWLPPPSLAAGALVMVHDATEARTKQQELAVKAALIKEVHHRVKNNLQSLASLVRMQARRAALEETQRELQEAVNRILSISIIHEFLSIEEGQPINIREVCQRIIGQVQQVAIPPELSVKFELQGPSIRLPSQQATACALVVNELLLNAVKHGYQNRNEGCIRTELTDGGDHVVITIQDDGATLPQSFELEQSSSLGLQIVSTLTTGDLKGEFSLNGGKGVSAVVTFPKQSLRGD